VTANDVTATVGSSLAGAIIALAIVVGRMRERLARLEEWARLQGRDK
jgi:hypothetical protein